MITSRRMAISAAAVATCTVLVHAQSAAHYREYQLGSDLRTVSALSGLPVAEATVVHERPALIQELRLRRPYVTASAASADPVAQVVFHFYDDQLFKVVVDYDRNRTEGLTESDMVAAISAQYGAASNAPLTHTDPAVDAPEGPRTVVARWGDAAYAVELYRVSYAPGFTLTVTSLRLDGLARAADARAAEMDAAAAPQRELARQKKDADDARTSREKARQTNRATFRP